jgi:hypothetical protein
MIPAYAFHPPTSAGGANAEEIPVLRAILVAFAVGALGLTIVPADRAAAMTVAARSELASATPIAARVHTAHFTCDSRCARRWPPRQYWQWDQRPVWDDPWMVLRPNFWGSPEPYFVPADQWAHEWHPPWIRHWRPRHPH